MIRLIEDIQHMESQKVSLDPNSKRVYIEVASNQKIDVAVVDDRELKQFTVSETPWEVAIDWHENTRNVEFEYMLSGTKNRFLLLWNSNQENDAIVAYKITPIE